MYRVKITKEAVVSHFQYDKIKYLIGAIAVSLVWAIIINVSAPKVPADKKIDIYLAGGSMAFDGAKTLSEKILDAYPELLEVNIENIELDKDNTMNHVNTQKLLTRLQAKSGDIFVFSKEDYLAWAKQGAFIPIEHIADELNEYINPEDLDALKTDSKVDSDVRLYGIPLYNSELSENNELFSNFYNVFDSVISIIHYSKNKEKAEEIVKWIIKTGYPKSEETAAEP